jgi:energy-coupling factor transporter ATP-binding protein EcfA2
MPLNGVGSDPWRALFEAAKTYSETLAYPGQDFPVAGPESRCVLCQQPLDDSARDRFFRFKDFVINQTARTADEARSPFESKRTSFQAMQTSLECDEIVKEIEERDKGLAEELRQLLASVKPRHKAVGNAIQTGDWSSLPMLPEVGLSKLDTLMNRVEQEAQKYDTMGEPEGLKERRYDHSELFQRLLLLKRLGEVLALIEDLKRRKRLDACIDALDTTRITRKSSDLMDAVSTEALRGGLVEELQALGINRLQLSLEKTGTKGIAFHQLRIPGHSQAKVALSEILSEGEQRVVALASFLAELNVFPGNVGIIFDDPVCSLDHEFREKVAKRLVQEGKHRQVVIFTHDIVFLLALEREAAKQKVPLTGQEIKREGATVGRCEADLPWEARNTGKRIGHLNRLLREDIRQSVSNQVAYRSGVEPFYALLRETWERAVEEILFYDTIQRFRPSIETQRLKQVSVHDEDYKRIHAGMTRCSAIMSGHDSAPAASAPPPLPDELQGDLDELDSFVDDLKKRYDQTKHSRDRLLAPPQA